MKKTFLISLLVIFTLAGCNSGNQSESYYTFPDGQWQRFDNPVIQMDITKPGIFYDMWLEFSYDPAIFKEPLPVTVIMSTPSGEIRRRNLNIVPGKNGGTLRLILRRDFAFSERGICSFEIENRSQNVTSAGVKNIGIVLERK